MVLVKVTVLKDNGEWEGYVNPDYVALIEVQPTEWDANRQAVVKLADGSERVVLLERRAHGETDHDLGPAGQAMLERLKGTHKIG